MTHAFVCSSASHEAQKRDRDAWRALPFVGIQASEGEHDALEIRNCVCGSTLCRPVAVTEAAIRRRRSEINGARHWDARLHADVLGRDGMRAALAADVVRRGNEWRR